MFILICYINFMNKRDNILNAALHLLVTQGEQATSMKWIAKEAKCGIGTMYNYFPSKENLINILYLELKKKHMKHFSGFDTDKPIKQQFFDTWRQALKYTIDHSIESKFLEICHHSPIISEQSKQQGLELLNPVIEILKKGKKEGIIKNQDSMQLVIFVSGSITASVLSRPEMSSEDINAILSMAWDAIKE